MGGRSKIAKEAQCTYAWASYIHHQKSKTEKNTDTHTQRTYRTSMIRKLEDNNNERKASKLVAIDRRSTDRVLGVDFFFLGVGP